MTDTLQTVYDIRDGSYMPGPWAKRLDPWITAQGIVLADTYRIEIHILDAPFARVFQYDMDEQGIRFLDPETGDIARRKPYDVPVSSMPPIPPAPKDTRRRPRRAACPPVDDPDLSQVSDSRPETPTPPQEAE